MKKSFLLVTKSLCFAILVIAPAAFAWSRMPDKPDKIGNGGGVWVCEDSSLKVFDIMFIDIYEAKREYQLNIPEVPNPYLDLVQLQKSWISVHLSEGAKIVSHVEYVEQNITWLEDIINLIPDSFARISPQPATCVNGKWDPVQLVNFTEDARILIRKDLFDSTYMSNVEKAAVYLHEGIYSYLRDEFGDSNSVRARAIVGFLFSDLPEDQKLARIQKVLGQNPPPPPPPPPPPGSWMCGLRIDSYSPLYVFEAETRDKAKAGALELCVQGEDPFGGNHGGPGFPFPGMSEAGGPGGFFPGGGFPGGGFPGGGLPGPQMQCKENLVTCEQILSQDKTRTCSFKSPFGSNVYQGKGRTILEAQKEVASQCLLMEGSPSRCNSTDGLSCQ